MAAKLRHIFLVALIAPLYIMNPARYQDSIDYLRKAGYLTGRRYQAAVAVRQFIVKLGAYRARLPNNKVPLIISPCPKRGHGADARGRR